MHLGSKPRKPLARESKKTIAEKPLRQAIVKQLLEDHPQCQIGEQLATFDHPQAHRCRGRATEVHEWVQRSVFPGAHLRIELCITTCRPCHDFCDSGDPIIDDLHLLVKSWEVADLVAAAARAEAES